MKKLVTAALICLILDQVTKWWIVNHIGLYENIWLYQNVRLTLTYNPGLIFGAFQDKPFLVNFVIIAASVILVIYTFTELKRNGHALSLIAVGMIFGGALGNTVDRVRLGKVVDFIAVGNFPVFNLADSSIVAGISLLILSYWVEGRSAKMAEELPAPEGGTGTPAEPESGLPEGSVLQDIVQEDHQGGVERPDEQIGGDADENNEDRGDGERENFSAGQVG
jgi:signal peptidase II